MAIDLTEFSDIRPYNDEEARTAFAKLSEDPIVKRASKLLFPNEDENYFPNVLKQLQSVDEFQILVVSKGIEWVIKATTSSFTYDGIENLNKVNGKFLTVSNHRDIIVDPAITQLVLYKNGFPTSQLCVGDNLLKNPIVESLIRANKMIKVIRGINARSLYLSSMLLSKYIRTVITTGTSSVWIAQREGRSKNGIDTTEQGLLKMFDMSGTKGFVENFLELNLIPLSISYEYEPCDIQKARETLISQTQKYVKSENEDISSIISGIRGWKGNVHLNIGEPLTRDEIEAASLCTKNDRYQFIRHAVDKRVISGYKLWKTNYMGYDLMTGTSKYASTYTDEELATFKTYIEKQLDKVEPELSRDELRDLMYHIYGNPVQSKEDLDKIE